VRQWQACYSLLSQESQASHVLYFAAFTLSYPVEHAITATVAEVTLTVDSVSMDDMYPVDSTSTDSINAQIKSNQIK
jgi:hypothetical protein